MRTPGDDLALAVGFLYAEGVLTQRSDLIDTQQQDNKINLILNDTSDEKIKQLDRHFYTSSSCGVCGKASIEALRPNIKTRPTSFIQVTGTQLTSLPDKLREAQKVFENTGGIHAAALFSTEGQLLRLCEDVGRHNALDKLIGQAFLADEDLSTSLLLLSGRISFELVHKATMAQISIIAAIGAPSTLAIETAEAFDISLIGFLSQEGFNCYHGDERLRIGG